MTHTDTLIVGGGLSGLRLADLMQQSGQDYLLVEARERLGGRILSLPAGDSEFDLGPAWFWRGQPRMAALADRFNLDVFEQYTKGNFRFENPQGEIAEGYGGGSMQGSMRLDGGMGALIDKLAATLPANHLLDGYSVSAAKLEAGDVTVTVNGKPDITARRVVLALPPRIAANLSLSPALPSHVVHRLGAVPTWMAGQAKAVALYDRPFWRSAGLSGDAMSHRGPMVEIHDASPKAGGPYALFGFIGVPPDVRQDEHALRQAITDQFTRLFGPDAPEPLEVLIKDWASDPQTATKADLAPLHSHPSYGLPSAVQNLWGGRLLLSGTETARDFGGYLEGALEAAETTFQTLTEKELTR